MLPYSESSSEIGDGESLQGTSNLLRASLDCVKLNASLFLVPQYERAMNDGLSNHSASKANYKIAMGSSLDKEAMMRILRYLSLAAVTAASVALTPISAVMAAPPISMQAVESTPSVTLDASRAIEVTYYKHRPYYRHGYYRYRHYPYYRRYYARPYYYGAPYVYGYYGAPYSYCGWPYYACGYPYAYGYGYPGFALSFGWGWGGGWGHHWHGGGHHHH